MAHKVSEIKPDQIVTVRLKEAVCEPSRTQLYCTLKNGWCLNILTSKADDSFLTSSVVELEMGHTF